MTAVGIAALKLWQVIVSISVSHKSENIVLSSLFMATMSRTVSLLAQKTGPLGLKLPCAFETSKRAYKALTGQKLSPLMAKIS